MAAGVGVGRDAWVDLHQDEAACPFGHLHLLEDGHDFRVGRVVDGFFQGVDVDLGGDADDGAVSADDVVTNTEDDGAATAVGHADGVLDDLIDGVVPAAGDPFLEVEVLVFEVVGRDAVEVVKEEADLVGGAHTGFASLTHIGLIVARWRICCSQIRGDFRPFSRPSPPFSVHYPPQGPSFSWKRRLCHDEMARFPVE